MKYFIDTEFHERNVNGYDTIELISIGIVCEDGREFYAISSEFVYSAARDNKWLYENVIKNLDDVCYWKRKSQIKKEILEFIPPESEPEFYGYYCDYDWVVFCWIFGRMLDLPKGYPMYCRDLKQILDATATGIDGFTFEQSLEAIKKDHKYPKQANEHNALADAKWNYELYKFLNHEM